MFLYCLYILKAGFIPVFFILPVLYWKPVLYLFVYTTCIYWKPILYLCFYTARIYWKPVLYVRFECCCHWPHIKMTSLYMEMLQLGNKEDSRKKHKQQQQQTKTGRGRVAVDMGDNGWVIAVVRQSPDNLLKSVAVWTPECLSNDFPNDFLTAYSMYRDSATLGNFRPKGLCDL